MTDAIIVLRFIAIIEQREKWRRSLHGYSPTGEGNWIAPEHTRSGLEVFGDQNSYDRFGIPGYFSVGQGCYQKRKRRG